MKNGGMLQKKATLKNLRGDALFIRYNAKTNLYEIWINYGLNGNYNACYSHLFIVLDNFTSFIKAYKFLKENKHAIY